MYAVYAEQHFGLKMINLKQRRNLHVLWKTRTRNILLFNDTACRIAVSMSKFCCNLCAFLSLCFNNLTSFDDIMFELLRNSRTILPKSSISVKDKTTMRNNTCKRLKNNGKQPKQKELLRDYKSFSGTFPL